MSTIEEIAKNANDTLKAQHRHICLTNLLILTCAETTKSIYFTASEESNKERPLTLLCVRSQAEVKDNPIVEAPLRYVGCHVEVEGNIGIDGYNQLLMYVDSDNEGYKFRIVDTSPHLPLRCAQIAVISNVKEHGAYKAGQGYLDFRHSLRYGNIQKYDAKMNDVKDVAEIIKTINCSNDCDCICIIRGGGDEDIINQYDTDETFLQAVRSSTIPIILGIGHANNSFPNLAKYVAKECINPTEAAYFLNERVERLINNIEKKRILCETILEQRIQ